MEIKTEKMPTPVKYIVTVDADDMENRKKKTYEQLKPDIVLPGFRKGNVPQDVAESHLGVERLYKTTMDDIFRDVVDLEQTIISSSSFKFYGDLKKKVPFIVEFIAEVRPTVKLASLDKIRDTVKIEEVSVSEDDLKKKIELEIKRSEIIQDTTKEVLENLDVAVIDFEGCLAGETKPFKGGIAKGYQIRVNEIVNGQKQFVGNFEDQLIGMKINETRQVNVTFPTNYRETSLAGKNAVFIVTLKFIKTKIIPEYNEQFARTKGFDTLETYEQSLKKQLLEVKQKNEIDALKRKIVIELIAHSEISPIPQIMIDRENENEWSAFQKRMGKTEEQLEKEKISKESFFDRASLKSIEMLKASLVLEQVAKDYYITATEDEVVKYCLRISNFLKFDEKREEKIKEELKTNKHQYRLMEIRTINEKTVEFLSSGTRT